MGGYSGIQGDMGVYKGYIGGCRVQRLGFRVLGLRVEGLRPCFLGLLELQISTPSSHQKGSQH